MMERLDSYAPGDTFEYRITFEKELEDGLFPRAFLRGPDTLESEHWVDIATLPTIAPDRQGATYILKGEIPKTARPGQYSLDRVEILYSKSGVNDAKLKRRLRFDELDNFAIIVEDPAPPRGPDIPRVVRQR
jgi:hypothetical protein